MRTGAGGVLLPTGTLTFLFTDVERSTDLLSRVGDAEFASLLARHSAMIRDSISAHRGVEVSTEGDSHFAVFPDPFDAVKAAVQIQQTVDVTAAGEMLKVRIGLHTGSAVLGGDNYVGVDVHRASRIASSGNGGQVLLSDVTSGLVSQQLQDGVTTHSLGRFRLAGFSEPAAIYQLDFPGVSMSFPPLRTRAIESRLPVSLTEFVGRNEEIAAGLRLLGERRLLTLTGPGGTGKTRLSLEIARRAESGFSDGAYFVPLAALTDAGGIPMAILEAIELTTAPGVDPRQHLERYLRDREILLVLDNFEQLVDGSSIVSDLLESSPSLKVVASSRSPLRLPGEHELPVPPLEVPGLGQDVHQLMESEGVQLFTRRAEGVRPDFELTAENADAVAAIVRALDGLPLAIELAASRLRTFTPQVVLDRLNNQLLSGQGPGLPKRQQTIVNTIGWSYDLLDEGTRELFEQVSIFTGSFGLAEAEEICDGDVFAGLADLVDHSLLRQTETTGAPRFRMLTVIKEFGYAALVSRGEDRRVADRHAAAFLALAGEASEEILTSHQGEWLSRLGADQENLRAAFDHLMNVGEFEQALLLAARLWRFWQIRGQIDEGIERLEEAIAAASDVAPRVLAAGYTALGGLLYWKGSDGAWLAYESALELSRAVGDEGAMAEALYNHSFGSQYSGDFDTAARLLEESRELSQQIGWSLGVGRVAWAQAMQASVNEDWATAIDRGQHALEDYEGLDAPFDIGWTWYMLGHSHYGAGQLSEAKSALHTAHTQFSGVRDLSAMALLLHLHSAICVAGDDRLLGSYLLGGADRVKVDTGVALADIEFNQYRDVTELRATFDADEKAQFDLGFEAPLEEVVARAIQDLVEPPSVSPEGTGNLAPAGP